MEEAMAQWWWKADYLETCNCAYGCPCNMTMLPTDGTCQAINFWGIREGAAGNVRLDGLCIGLFSRWPNPIHKGNGHGVLFVDDRADASQRDALAKIGTGQSGSGGPFEIFASTYTERPTVMFGPIRVEGAGASRTLRFGTVARADFGPLLSDMDRKPANARMVLPDGFIFKDAAIVNSELCEVKIGPLNFRHANTNAFISDVTYNL
jgi:hypothetical protein